ncbi:MAG TPA: APC family permease [Micromonosporaceae bacterium]
MSTPVQTPSVVTASLAKDRLGVFSVIMFAMTAAAPLLVVGGLVTTGWLATGVIGLPLAFVVIGIALAVFSVGYVAMARHVTNAGAFYSYIARGGSKSLGVGASFVAVLAYNMLQIGLYGGFGFFAQSFFTEKLSWNFHWWAYALVAWLVVALMGALRVDINSKILGCLLAVEVLVVVIFDVVDLAHPHGGSVSFTTFEPSKLFVSGVGVAFAIAVTGFTGFEAAPVFSEEARHAKRTVPAATYLAIAVMGIIYAITSWSIAVADGAGNLIADAQKSQSSLIFDVAGRFLGENSFIVNLGNVLLLTSVFAALVSFHNSVTRYSFALGRERVLPSALGRTRPRSGAPLVASAVQSVLALVVIIVYAAEGWDPLIKLFFWLGTTGGFGILILLVATSASVIKFFARDHGGESFWTRVIAPFLAFVALGYVGYETLNSYGNLLDSPKSDARWILPSLYAVVAVIGIIWAFILRSSKPDVYAAIGLGATAATGTVPAARTALDSASEADLADATSTE